MHCALSITLALKSTSRANQDLGQCGQKGQYFKQFCQFHTYMSHNVDLKCKQRFEMLKDVTVREMQKVTSNVSSEANR